jgi:foldase protein PrsA
MLYKRLIVTSALVLAVAIPSIAYGATTKQKPTADKKAPAVAKPAPAKPTAAPEKPAAPATNKPTQEENLKKFKAAPDSTVVATVGDEKITKGDLMSILWDWYGPSALEYYISTRIVPQEMKKAGVKVTDKEIDEAIKKIPLGPGMTLDVALQTNKTTLAQLKAGYAIKLGLQKLAEKQCEPTDADYATYLKASHILVSVMPPSSNPTPEDMEKLQQAAKEKAEKILAEIKAGKPFADAAKEYSECPSKSNGGDLGWFRKSDMAVEFSEAASALKPGEMSEPVKSDFGYHIILLEKSGSLATAAEKNQIKEMLVKSTLNAKMQQMYKDIEAKTKIDNKISPKIEMPKPDVTSGGPMSYPGGSRPATKQAPPVPSKGKSVPAGHKPIPNAPSVPEDTSPAPTPK